MIVFDCDLLYDSLDRRRRTYRMSWRDVADATGVSAATLSRMAKGDGGINATTLVRLLTWTGCTDVYPFITAEQDGI